MLRHLDRQRFAPYVVTLDDSGQLRNEAHALAPVYEVKLTGKLFNRQGLRELWRLRKWLRDERIEIVHGLMDRATIYGALAAKLAGGLPVVASHRYTVLPVGRGLAIFYVLVIRFLVHHVIPNTHAAVPWLEKRGIRRGRITVVHNGISLEHLSPVVERPHHPSPVTICCVGRLDEVKGQHLLVEAVGALAKEGHTTKVVLVGSGPEEHTLRKRASDLGIADAIEWTGYLPDPTDVLRRSDICVLTSYNEGFPNAVLEYLAAGRPVVATVVGGVPEMVRPEVTGLLVPPGDAHALAQALKRLMTDDEARRRMGWAGRAFVEAELTVVKEVERTQEVYTHVLAESRS